MSRNLTIPQASTPMPPRIPPPRHRHAAPSGPWPFLDIDDEIDPERIEDPNSHLPMSAQTCNHAPAPGQDLCWCKYPQGFFPNWTLRQQKKSRIADIVARDTRGCTIRYLDVMDDGAFVDAGEMEVNPSTQDKSWHTIQAGRPAGVSIRVLFTENLSGPVLQMLGARYNIEPFFFSSSIGWIPSRFQSNVVPKESDHITITLTFIRPIKNPKTAPPSPSIARKRSNPRFAQQAQHSLIDTQAPLPLRSSDLLLVHDLLALHMVRSPKNSSIISYHPGSDHCSTSAEALKTRLHSAGRSVYWNNVFTTTNDPTFLLICLLWYALYAWDEALEALYSHVCILEAQIIHFNNIEITNELHLIYAHLLHYEALLQDFKKTVLFVLNTPNPCFQDPERYSSKLRRTSEATMRKECDFLLREIDRLEMQREMQASRLKNVMKLGFNMIKLEDSRSTASLTEATIQDSSAMKLIGYLTMVFFPASFVADAMGMNITILTGDVPGTIGKYFAIAVPLTVITTWILIAYQVQIGIPPSPPVTNDTISDLGEDGEGKERRGIFWRYKYYGLDAGNPGELVHRAGIWIRLWWPMILAFTMLERRESRKRLEKRKQA